MHFSKCDVSAVLFDRSRAVRSQIVWSLHFSSFVVPRSRGAFLPPSDPNLDITKKSRFLGKILSTANFYTK